MSTTIGEPPEDASSQRTPPVPGGQSALPPIPPRLNTSPSPSSTGRLPGSDPATQQPRFKPNYRQPGGRKNHMLANKVDGLAKRIVAKLNTEIERGNATTPFLIMIAVAVFKDTLDIGWDSILAVIQVFLVVGQIAGAVLAKIKFLLGMFCSALLLAFVYKKGAFLKMRTKIKYAIILFVFGNLPLLEIMPWETLTILKAWKNVKKRAAKAAKAKETIQHLHKNRLEELEKDVDNGFGTED